MQKTPTQKECREALGRFLKSARGRMTLKEVSERLTDAGHKTSPSTLSRIENATCGVAIDEYRALCHAYRASYKDLMESMPGMSPAEE